MNELYILDLLYVLEEILNRIFFFYDFMGKIVIKVSI